MALKFTLKYKNQKLNKLVIKDKNEDEHWAMSNEHVTLISLLKYVRNIII